MKRTIIFIVCLSACILSLFYSRWIVEQVIGPEFSPVLGQTIKGGIIEAIPDPGIPDVTGRKKGLVQLSAFPGMFKSDKERREWLSKWAQDKETKDWVKDGPTSSLSPHPQSTEGVFGEHRIVPTIGGAEDEAPFYPSTPVEYAMLQTDLRGEHWYGGSRVIFIPDEDCACVCCPCCPCPGGLPSPEEVITPIEYPSIPPTFYHPVKPPKWPPTNPPIEPPVDPPVDPPPKVPEGSTLWMLMLGMVALQCWRGLERG